ncbi:pyrroline-5-carboxylate reductase [Bacillus sp. HMF5848]|uniref:pyrroline-5-carboxylate reductase ProI n=1 Tax=Bacillus sp. HMF5848 TaxID=2495421 RepID=UPI000F772AC6|nr:pyrroline-5-carboxylate reductase ProI [Bacillus sp. HMF5848]RSK27739.1 pyrroline-5-carboxylate reductase [Bacillus sp. HMF5848]
MKDVIGFMGAGSMAEAMIGGMLKERLFAPGQILVTNRSNYERLYELRHKYGVQMIKQKPDIIKKANIVVLTMKPKDAVDGLQTIAPFIHEDQLIISVMAGVSTQSMIDILKKQVAIIRAMPNTSAAIGKSATAIALGRYATDTHLQKAKQLLETIGIVKVVNERDMHAITGLSGSGPAYVYYLVEAMEKAAIDIGLEASVAKELILQTIMGAAEMLQQSDKHPSILRREVTSPGGTTEAGIGVLEQHQYQEAMIACIKRATERSGEMGASLHEKIVKEAF